MASLTTRVKPTDRVEEELKLLADEVKKYPIIYDARHPDYKNCHKRACTWKEITMNLGFKPDDQSFDENVQHFRKLFTRVTKEYFRGVAKSSQAKNRRKIFEFLDDYVKANSHAKKPNKTKSNQGKSKRKKDKIVRKRRQPTEKVEEEMKLLADELKNYPFIYDSSLPGYKNNHMRSSAWKEITTNLGYNPKDKNFGEHVQRVRKRFTHMSNFDEAFSSSRHKIGTRETSDFLRDYANFNFNNTMDNQQYWDQDIDELLRESNHETPEGAKSELLEQPSRLKREVTSPSSVNPEQSENEDDNYTVYITQTILPSEEHFVVMKSEPEETCCIEDVSFCQCCFKTFAEFDEQHQASEKMLQAFQDIVQIRLQSCSFARAFCSSCYASISSFDQFRELAALKQQKFNEILATNSGDISEIQHLTIDGPLVSVKREEEKEDMTIVQSEIYPSVPMNRNPPSKRKVPTQSSSKTVQQKPTYRECSICKKGTYNMYKHILTTHVKKCKLCSYRTANVDKMFTHMKSEHEQEEEVKTCGFCQNKFSVKDIKYHEEHAHGREHGRFYGKFQCDLCPFRTFHKPSVRYHVELHLPKTYYCSKCNFTTHTDQRLEKHKKKFHGKKNEDLLCVECNIEFRNIYNLNLHIKRIHEKIKDHECDQCGLKFFQKIEVEFHWKNNHGVKSFICEVCGKAYGNSRLLKRHRTIHNEKKFDCHSCSAKFASPRTLLLHNQRLHLKIRKFRCDDCGKEYYDIGDFKAHQLSHAGIRFNCFAPGCSSSLSRKDNLVSHMKKRHKLSPIERQEYMDKLNAYCASLREMGLDV